MKIELGHRYLGRVDEYEYGREHGTPYEFTVLEFSPSSAWVRVRFGHRDDSVWRPTYWVAIIEELPVSKLEVSL